MQDTALGYQKARLRPLFLLQAGEQAARGAPEAQGPALGSLAPSRSTALWGH